MTGATGATGAELFLRTLQDRGVRFIFMNPGTDTYPVQEAYAKLAAAGEPLPQLLMAPFESLASSAAQGAYLATGEAQVAFVHVDVGTANASGSLNDAKGNRIPLLLCAGRSPISIEATPGGRSKYINWAQDVPDQAAMVRNYVKNEQIAYRPEAIPRTVQRALQVAESAPAGPVYISFPREALQEVTELGSDIDASRYPAVRSGSPNAEDVEQLAEWILAADKPVVVANYLGRNPDAVRALVELSELAGIGVVEYRGSVNFPLTHPHHLGFASSAATDGTDLLIAAEHDVPYVPVLNEPARDAKLVHIGQDPFWETIQTWGFPSDLGIRADAARTLDAVRLLLDERLDDAGRERIAARSAALGEQHEAWSSKAWETLEATPGEPATPAFIGQVLDELLPEHAVVFEESVTSGNPIALQMKNLGPGRLFRNGGSYLGWGLAAATGFGLASEDRFAVALSGDGSFLFSVPSAVLWFASRNQVPVLSIVCNNARYNSVRLAGRDGYPDGSQATHGYVADDFEVAPQADKIAEACGVRGFAAADGTEFRDVLKQALAEIEAGRPALITVQTEAAPAPL